MLSRRARPALTRPPQLLARQREETNYYKTLLASTNAPVDSAGVVPPPAEGSDEHRLLQQTEAAARALRVELARTRVRRACACAVVCRGAHLACRTCHATQEALAASTAQHAAVLAEREAATAERDALQAERDAFAAQHAALCDERDALLEERDALQLQVYSPGVFVDANVSPLRAAAVELNAHFRSKSGAAVRTGEEDAGGPASSGLAAHSGSPRRGSGQRAPDGPDGTVSRLLARMGLSGDSARTAE